MKRKICFLGIKKRGPTVKIAGVTVNAKLVLQANKDLEPIARVIPSVKDERRK